MPSAPGKRLARWLLYHYPSYLRGAVDPDERFCDFHNHVIHAADGYWGGAPRVAQQWYDRLQKHLRAERYDEAAHAAGVLSHYLTDVIQPLHTISTGREGVIHQPFERGVWHAYDSIAGRLNEEGIRVDIHLSERRGWLGSLMLHSARFAHVRADTLCRRFQLHDALTGRESGLDGEAIDCLAELFGLAITSVGRVIDRAAQESEAYNGYQIPRCHQWSAKIGATLKTPVALFRNRIADHRRRIAVEDLAQEYFRTGELNEYLPAEVDVKRRVIEVRQQERSRRPRRRKAA